MEYCLKPSILSLYLALMTADLTSQTSELRDYCDIDTFHAHCSHGEIVLMKEASFGRMELGTCLTADYLLGCFRDVLPYMDRWCSGRMSCDVPVIDLQRQTNPCTTDMRSYLQASFTCIPVVNHGGNCCQLSNDDVLVTANNGYLASSMTLQTGCGREDCPWQLQAIEGQHINISIYDFGRHALDSEYLESTQNSGNCFGYATLTEEATGATVRVCGGRERKRHIYISTTNRIQIHIDEQNENEGDILYFVMEYAAIGCVDPSIPDNALLNRVGDHATIICPGTNDIVWEITCHDGQWIGSYGNCSAGSAENQPGGPSRGDDAEKNPNNSLHLEPQAQNGDIRIRVKVESMNHTLKGIMTFQSTQDTKENLQSRLQFHIIYGIGANIIHLIFRHQPF